jgi:hypothetical protein
MPIIQRDKPDRDVGGDYLLKSNKVDDAEFERLSG